MSLVLLGIRAGVSGTQALMQMRSAKDQKKMMQYTRDRQLQMIDKGTSRKLNAMQENYLMSLRDTNSAYATSVGALSREYDKARSQSAVATSVNPNVNIANSSHYIDGLQAVSDEYTATVTRAGATLKDNAHRMSRMNVEKRMGTLTQAEQKRLDVQLDYDTKIHALDKQTQGAIFQAGASMLNFGVARNTSNLLALDNELRKRRRLGL